MWKIIIDKKKYKENYIALQNYSRSLNVVAALKHNGYGLGIKKISSALFEVGCKWFLLSSMKESLILRKSLGASVNIINLGANFKKENFETAWENKIITCLSSLEELNKFKKYIRKEQEICLYFDTGLSGKGFCFHQLETVKEETKDLNIVLVMSHLACAWKSNDSRETNKNQLEKFKKIKEVFGTRPLYSLVNTDGIRLGPEFINHLPRAGRGLHGLSCYEKEYGIKQAFKVWGPICRVDLISEENTYVGYGGLNKMEKGNYLGVVEIGAHTINQINFKFTNEIIYKKNKYNVLGIFVGYMVVDFKKTKPNFGEKVELNFISRFNNDN